MYRLQSLVELLVREHPSITDTGPRRRARLFAALTLGQAASVTLALLIINTVLRGPRGSPIWGDWDSIVILIGVALILVAYVLIRVGLARLGVSLYILVTCLVALVAPFLPSSEIGTLASVVIPVILTSAAFSNAAAAAVLAGVTALAALELAIWHLPVPEMSTGLAVLLTAVTASGLVLIFRWHVAALERDRAAEVDRSRAATQQSEDRYRRLFETVTDGIFIADGQGRFLEVNDRACRQLGYTREELLSTSLDVVTGRSKEVLRTTMENVTRKGDVFWETEHIRKDGTRLPVELVVSRVEYQGMPAFMGVSRDMTERIRARAERDRLERQLQHAVKMESIGRLAGGVAHDFNNLLTAILGNTELALARPDTTPEVREHLGDVMSAARSAVSLTRQLLTFSRRQILSPRPVLLGDLIGKLTSMLLRIIGEDVMLTIQGEGSTAVIHADPTMVEQVIVNLAANARDAMPRGGALTLEIRCIRLDREGVTPGEYVLLAVRDTGTGMTEDVRAHLFEPFFTTKEPGHGTGLGLATTYGAVRQSGGHIEVETSPGQGTTFLIYFPRFAGAVESDPASASAGEALRGTETVLLVEDATEVRDLAGRMLAILGYVVLSARNAEEALDLAMRTPAPIHLLLTDVVMPGSNGRRLAEQLTETHPETRVLYCSGYSQDIIARHGVLDPGIHFLPKPYALNILAAKVREILDGGRAGI